MNNNGINVNLICLQSNREEIILGLVKEWFKKNLTKKSDFLIHSYDDICITKVIDYSTAAIEYFNEFNKDDVCLCEISCGIKSEFYLIDSNVNMRNPISFIVSEITQIFQSESVVVGKSYQNNYFLIENRPQFVDCLERMVNKAIMRISNVLVKKCLKMMSCDEIVTLLIEKTLIYQSKECQKEKISCNSKITVNSKLNSDTNGKSFSKKTTTSYEISKTSLEKTNKMVISENTSSLLYKYNKNKANLSENTQNNKSNNNKLAAGDIQRIIHSRNGLDENQFTPLNRIMKAKNWLNRNKKFKDLKNDPINVDQCYKGKIEKHVTHAPINSAKVVKEKVKHRRFTVKKLNETNSSLTQEKNNMTHRPTANHVFKNLKTRYFVTKNNKPTINSNIQHTNQNDRGKLKKKINSSGVKSTLSKSQIHSYFSLRKDMLQLAEKLNENYLNYTKEILENGDDISNRFDNIKSKGHLKKPSKFMSDIKKRISIKQSNKLTKSINKLDKVNSVKCFFKEFAESSINMDSTFSDFTSNCDSTIYKTTGSSMNSSTFHSALVGVYDSHSMLNTCDLQEIHKITEEIHILAGN